MKKSLAYMVTLDLRIVVCVIFTLGMPACSAIIDANSLTGGDARLPDGGDATVITETGIDEGIPEDVTPSEGTISPDLEQDAKEIDGPIVTTDTTSVDSPTVIDVSTVDSTPAIDAATVDTTIVDTATIDTTAVDTTTIDIAVVDTAVIDVATVDTTTVDAAAVDTTTVDTATVDTTAIE